MKISGGCHCGAVRFHFDSPVDVELVDCNCSMCHRTGFLHMFVPHDIFMLECGDADLVSYRFGTETANHLFCRHCGIKSFYQPRSHPDAWSVNFRCLDEGHGLRPSIRPFDGRNDWEEARRDLG